MTEKAIFKDVWQRSDAKAKEDAIAAWTAAGYIPRVFAGEERARQLCVVGYEGDELVSLSTAHIRYLPMVRENMALFRVFVVAGHRQKGLAVPLTYATHEALGKFALAHPELKIGGIAGIVIVGGYLDSPVTNAGLALAGYTEENDPVVIRWFDHFKLDEAAARARGWKQDATPLR